MLLPIGAILFHKLRRGEKAEIALDNQSFAGRIHVNKRIGGDVRYLNVSMFVGLVIATTGCASKWQEVKNTQAGFSVMIPEDFREEEKIVHDSVFNIDVKVVSYYAFGPFGGFFNVSCADVPLDLKGIEPPFIYDNFLKGIIFTHDRLLKSRKIFLDGVEGREVIVLRGDGCLDRIRLFYTNKKLYELSVLSGSKWVLLQPGAGRFFHSFRFL